MQITIANNNKTSIQCLFGLFMDGAMSEVKAGTLKAAPGEKGQKRIKKKPHSEYTDLNHSEEAAPNMGHSRAIFVNVSECKGITVNVFQCGFNILKGRPVTD